ncbi:uncharacterized protein LOC116130227 isoform X2 [Pistacia vera]|uniref:uncharacterized protein LOC116130227 isoform X1 n=1 Tax=Pistacia vera TaxID=55513 RepID=UPI0012639C48|nr:uncharacterized protein LOC116130227 isoform X1 [Pistacia vera]XP_031271828.1 uncharacterized protein LOC116130227 isoform X2 [Pistacia vera]
MVKDLSLSELVYPELKTRHRLDYGKNFRIWRSQVDFVLEDNEVKYVLTQPIPEKQTHPEAHQKFVDDDYTARHIILGALSEGLYMSYHRHSTAKSLLDALTSFFTKPSMSRRMTALRRYVTHKMSDDTSAHEHVLKMSELAMELKLEGVDIPDELEAVFLMNSLPDSWEDSIFGMILNIDSDEKGLSMNNVRDIVRATGSCKEFFRARDRDEVKSISGSSSWSFKFRGKCYGCGEAGHRQADCPYEDAL